MKISSSYSTEMVISEYPLRFRLSNFVPPRNMKTWGCGGGRVTKPNSRLSSFEFGLAISNFKLEYQSHRSNKYATQAQAVRYNRILQNTMENAHEYKHMLNLDSRRADRQSLLSVNTKTHYENTTTINV